MWIRGRCWLAQASYSLLQLVPLVGFELSSVLDVYIGQAAMFPYCSEEFLCISNAGFELVFKHPKIFNLSSMSAFTQTNTRSLLCATHVAGSQNSNKPVGLWTEEYGIHC